MSLSRKTAAAYGATAGLVLFSTMLGAAAVFDLPLFGFDRPIAGGAKPILAVTAAVPTPTSSSTSTTTAVEEPVQVVEVIRSQDVYVTRSTTAPPATSPPPATMRVTTTTTRPSPPPDCGEPEWDRERGTWHCEGD